VLILLSFCLCGCAQVNFVTYHNDDGSIYEYVYLTIDEHAIINYGYNLDSVKLDIQTNSHIEANALIEQYRTKLNIEYQSNNITNEDYTDLFNGVTILEQNWNNGEYVIGLNFDNSNIYKKYYELLNGTTFNSNTKKIEKPFYTKTYYYGTTNYGDYSIFNRIYNYYTNTVFATISPQKTSLTYSYSVSTKRFHSDADQINIDSNGNYVHTWNVSPDEPARKIYFYTISANRSMWILTCVGIGFGICLILCAIGLIKYLKNKNKPKETTLNNIENNNLLNQ
jgi:hypothetical protein